MVKMSGTYQGHLRCELTHGPSGGTLTTDAPKDNQGQGASFSPTDLLAVSLGACMMTVMGIAARRQNLELSGSTFEVVKEMVADPLRRVGAIQVQFHMAAGIPSEHRQMLEHAAHTCPVHQSLHPGVKMQIDFVWR